MQSSLQKLASLDPSTVSQSHPLQKMDSLLFLLISSIFQFVYCGHEYTKKNLEFAAMVEPTNTDLQMKRADLKSVTIPSTIGDELKFNPFMRTHQASVQAFTGKSDPIECMAVLRERKNRF